MQVSGRSDQGTLNAVSNRIPFERWRRLAYGRHRICCRSQELNHAFYRKLLSEPLLLESVLHEETPRQLAQAGDERSVLQLLSHTFFYQRLLRNPAYYRFERNRRSCIRRVPVPYG